MREAPPKSCYSARSFNIQWSQFRNENRHLPGIIFNRKGLSRSWHSARNVTIPRRFGAPTWRFTATILAIKEVTEDEDTLFNQLWRCGWTAWSDTRWRRWFFTPLSIWLGSNATGNVGLPGYHMLKKQFQSSATWNRNVCRIYHWRWRTSLSLPLRITEEAAPPLNSQRGDLL